MVTLVWFVLSLFHVCSFSWIPLLIEGFFLLIWSCKRVIDQDDSNMPVIYFIVALGAIVFSFYKLFFHLNISPWWLLLAPLAATLIVFFPGGFTIAGLVLSKVGLMTFPTWGLVVSIIADVIMLILLITIIVEWFKKR